MQGGRQHERSAHLGTSHNPHSSVLTPTRHRTSNILGQKSMTMAPREKRYVFSRTGLRGRRAWKKPRREMGWRVRSRKSPTLAHRRFPMLPQAMKRPTNPRGMNRYFPARLFASFSPASLPLIQEAGLQWTLSTEILSCGRMLKSSTWCPGSQPSVGERRQLLMRAKRRHLASHEGRL